MSVAIDTQDTERREIGPVDPLEKIDTISNRDRETELPGSYKMSAPEQKDVRKIRNAILLVFVIAITAQKSLKEGHKQTKLDNSALEKRCKELNGRVSIALKDGVKSNTRWNYMNIVVPTVTVGSLLYSNWAAGQGDDWWEGKVNGCTHYASYVNWVPKVGGFADAVPAAVGALRNVSEDEKRKQMTRYVENCSGSASTMLGGKIKNLDVEMQAERAPLDAAYNAANSLYQARTQDESSDKQAVDGARRTIEEAMRQEEKLFEGALGKG